jgi:hypothetical protein
MPASEAKWGRQQRGPLNQPERLWGVNTIERRAVSHAYGHKRMFIRNMFVVGVILVAIANGKTQGAV